MAQLNKFLSFASSSLWLWSMIIIACGCNGTKSNKSCTFRSFRNVAFLSRGWAISTLVLIIEMGGGFVTIKPFTRQTQNSLQTYFLLSSIGTWARCRICGIPNISLVAFSAKTEIGSESAAALSEPLSYHLLGMLLWHCFCKMWCISFYPAIFVFDLNILVHFQRKA